MTFFLWLKQQEKLLRGLTIMLAVILLIPTGVLFHSVNQPEPEKIARQEKEKQPSRGISISRKDLILMARVIEGEAADESYRGKVAVGAVIVNRLQSADFPPSVRGVLFQPDAFEAVTNGQYKRPLTQESIRAAKEALSGRDPTNGALYYWNPEKATSKWVWSRPIIMKIGNHVFAR